MFLGDLLLNRTILLECFMSTAQNLIIFEDVFQWMSFQLSCVALLDYYPLTIIIQRFIRENWKKCAGKDTNLWKRQTNCFLFTIFTILFSCWRIYHRTLSYEKMQFNHALFWRADEQNCKKMAAGNVCEIELFTGD